MKKYYSFFVIVMCTILISGILLLEKNNKKPHIQNQQQEIKDNRQITEGLSPSSKLIIKNQILIQAGEICSWNINNNVALGVYCKKNHLPKIILKETELTVDWVTTKRVLLPGLVFTSENKDTTIFAKTSSGKEIYIVVVSGENLELITKRNKTYYFGESRLSTMEDLKHFFELKIQ